MDGIINVYKEKGMTSFDVTYRLRSILSERKIGHAGTLDPMAEGVLVVCAGKATKLVDSIAAGEKVYEAELMLGLETDTEDITGEVSRTAPVVCSEQAVREAVHSMQGECWQIPPMYSAKKQNGKRLYALAREGKVVERRASRITVYEIRTDEIALPYVRFTVRCSKGTYVRTLCAEIGRKLGCGAVMSALRRSRVGSFRAEDSFTLSALLERKEAGTLWTAVKPPIYIPEDTAVTFGKFDGGHLGHQRIFGKLFETAREQGLKTAVLTFSQNPDVVVRGENRPSISPGPEHLSRLRNFGFDYVFEFPMTRETMRLPAEDFLREVLLGEMRARAIVVGTDCSFGYRAEGSAAFLRERETVLGYRLYVVDKVTVADSDGSIREISSSLIKEKIAAGEIELANAWLGRCFSVAGAVIHGRRFGGPLLSFPTANIRPTEGKVIPALGVYVSRVFLDGVLYWAVTNVGTNPTISEGNPVNIETHILDYEGDLYGQKIRVDFLKRLRGQKKFASLAELKAQLLRDREAARAYAAAFPRISD